MVNGSDAQPEGQSEDPLPPNGADISAVFQKALPILEAGYEQGGNREVNSILQKVYPVLWERRKRIRRLLQERRHEHQRGEKKAQLHRECGMVSHRECDCAICREKKQEKNGNNGNGIESP